MMTDFTKINIRTLVCLFAMLEYVASILHMWSPLWRGVLFVAPIALWILYFMESQRKINWVWDGFTISTLLFVLYCFLTSFWAYDSSTAINQSIAVSKKVFGVLPIYLCFRCFYEDGVEDLFKILMIGGYIIVGILLCTVGFSEVLWMIENGARMSSENFQVNPNTIGMMVAFTILINFYFVSFRSRCKSIFFLFGCPCIAIIAYAGSRKGLFLFVAGIFFLTVIKSFIDGRMEKIYNLIKVIIAVLVISTILYNMLQLPLFEMVNQRMINAFDYLLKGESVREGSVYARLKLMHLGWELFLNNFLGGVGLDCARFYAAQFLGYSLYLHSNPIELLACTGLFGFSMYYGMHFQLFKGFWRNRKQYMTDKLGVVVFLFLCLRIVMEFACVIYYDFSTYFWLALFFLEMYELQYRGNNR